MSAPKKQIDLFAKVLGFEGQEIEVRNDQGEAILEQAEAGQPAKPAVLTLRRVLLSYVRQSHLMEWLREPEASNIFDLGMRIGVCTDPKWPLELEQPVYNSLKALCDKPVLTIQGRQVTVYGAEVTGAVKRLIDAAKTVEPAAKEPEVLSAKQA